MSDIPAKKGPQGAWKYTPEKLAGLSLSLQKFADSEPLPLLEEFCCDNSLYPSDISRYSEKDELFCKALNYFRLKQKAKWILHLVKTDKSPSGIIFILKNITDMRDEKHIKATVDNLIQFAVDGKNLPSENRLMEYLSDENA